MQSQGEHLQRGKHFTLWPLARRASIWICLYRRQLDRSHKCLQTRPKSTAPTKQVVSTVIFYTIYTVQAATFFFFFFGHGTRWDRNTDTVTDTTLSTKLAERTTDNRHRSARERSTKHQNIDDFSINIKIIIYGSHFYVHIALLFRSLYVHQQVQNAEHFSVFGLDFNFRIAVVVFIPAFTCFTYFVHQGAISSYVTVEAKRSVSHLN